MSNRHHSLYYLGAAALLLWGLVLLSTWQRPPVTVPDVPLAITSATGKSAAARPFDPPALYLTWQRDPTTTMIVCWQSSSHLRGGEPGTQIEYRQAHDTVWNLRVATAELMPRSSRVTHQVELTGLQPGTEYLFRFNEYSREYSFRTMPALLSRPIQFAVGGDAMHRRTWWEKTNRQVLRHDPDFILLGGDLCYEDGRRTSRVLDWLAGAKCTLITANGRIVPILAAIGNHEVAGGYGQSAEQAPFYYHLFPFPGKQGFGALDFGDYLSLLLLDSGHTNPIGGVQTEWLRLALSTRQKVPHVFPIYHMPAFPSVRAFESEYSRLVREHWTPLFDEFGVRVAFENHDHAYKRTHPIFGGKVDEARGVTYLGDGAWGVRTRRPHRNTWYLAKAEAKRHFILATIDASGGRFEAFDDNGKSIDQPVETRFIASP